jgi:glycosyltransferase involved in cell wall biosynthesis
MKVLLAHPGTQHAPRLAHELDERGALGEFWTGLALAEGGLAAGIARRLGRWPALAGLATRIVPGVTPARLHTLPLNELRALRRLRRGDDSPSTLHERNRRFQERIPAAAFRAHDAVIGFDTSAWILGERARRAGKPFLLDRSIAHPAAYARIVAGLNRQYPDWAEAVAGRPDYLVAAEAQEHALADRIAVGGSFARDTLVQEGIAAEKIRINPYGVDWTAFAPPAATGAPDRPFRFLYVGSVIARKGVPVLLDAWRRLALKNAELWIAGGIGPRERRLIPDLPGLKLLGQVPRAQIPGIFAQADVFVLPSLFEGFGLVLLEAVAAGLPLIATPHTGALELLAASAPGQLVAPGSVDELAAALQQWRAEPGAHRAAVARVREGLQEKFSWTAYGDRSVRMLEEIC